MTAFLIFQATSGVWQRFQAAFGRLGCAGMGVIGLNVVMRVGSELPLLHGLLGFFRLPILWAAFFVCACQIACAHQKFADDFVAHKFELLFEQPNPCFFAARMVGI